MSLEGVSLIAPRRSLCAARQSRSSAGSRPIAGNVLCMECAWNVHGICMEEETPWQLISDRKEVVRCECVTVRLLHFCCL